MYKSPTSVVFEKDMVKFDEKTSSPDLPLLPDLKSSDSSDTSCSQVRVLPNVPKAASASDIRCRLLTRLGISKEQEPVPLNSGTVLKVSPVLHEPLKADHGRPDTSLEASPRSAPVPSFMSQYGGKRGRGVSFDSSVEVHPIPCRGAYSDRIKNTLWTPPLELQENAIRNTFEFAAEGWDWKSVAEDTDMVLYEGERIHPVHYVPEHNLNQHFANIMAQQQQQQQQQQQRLMKGF
jgi:hypothetical protein